MSNEKGRSGVHVNIISSVFFNKKFKKRALGREKRAFGRKKTCIRAKGTCTLVKKAFTRVKKNLHLGEKACTWANNSKLYFQNVHLEVTFI